MSPNYPERYPNSHYSTQTVQVAEGKTIHFNIINFNTEPEYDYVEIIDEDGTNLTPPGSGPLPNQSSSIGLATPTSHMSTSTPTEIRSGLAGESSGMNSRYRGWQSPIGHE